MKSYYIKKYFIFPIKSKSVSQKNSINRQKNYHMQMNRLMNISGKSKSQDINPNISQNKRNYKGFLWRKFQNKQSLIFTFLRIFEEKNRRKIEQKK